MGRGQWPVLLATGVFALLVLALPPTPSFADLAGQRPRDTTSDEGLSFVLPPASAASPTGVRLLRSQPDPRLFAGDPVRISGFVLRWRGNRPQLARLLVRCCLADATPVGLPVRWPAGRPLPRADQWLALEGRMGLEPGPGGERLVVLASGSARYRGRPGPWSHEAHRLRPRHPRSPGGGQQQWLLRQPPRLEALVPAPASSGPAALRVRFSRPMQAASVAAASGGCGLPCRTAGSARAMACC